MNLFPRESPFLFSAGGYATLSFIPTLGTMLLGLVAGRALQQNHAAGRKQILLWSAAVICMLVAVAVDAMGICPIVKRIWTPTWTLWSGGICFAWLASLHLICDMAGWKWWGFPFLVIGSNSIVAYVISWTLVEPIHQALERHFGFVINAITRVLENLLSQFASLNDHAIVREFTLGAITMCVVWLMLWWLYSKKVFVKI
jgi:predicted acyltransferase